MGGGDATAAEAEDDETLRLLVCDALDAALGTSEAARHCRRMLRTRWSRDEFSRGAYSRLPPGATPDDATTPRAAGAPRPRALLRDDARGALLSGEREAKRVKATSDDGGYDK